MNKSKAKVALVAVFAALAGLICYAALILSSTGAGANMSIPLGLDLSGGVSITYRILDENPSKEDIADTKYKLQRRVESYSTEATVYQVGEDRITVEIPGVTDANAILEELGNPGSLEFRLPDGSVYMTGDMIERAEAATTTNSYGVTSYVVELIMTDEGADIFAKVTSENIGKVLPIVYDGEVISEPVVADAITGGEAVISGMSSYEEAKTLATQIRIGALSLELQELESSVVGAQLGSHAISSSLKAAAFGLILVAIFMTVMYLLPGAVATISLAIYTCLVIITLYLFEITLTLPGIAGIILGIGMAVDADIVIFARIRDEIATGKTVSTSIKIGFKKAMSAILDGNVTTMLASIVLIALGSGSIKGFAYTLIIGIALSMFSSLFVTRWILLAFYAIGLQDEKFYGRNRQRKTIDFIGKRAVFFVLSLLAISSGFIGMAAQKANGNPILNYGLDFVGGTSTTADFGKNYTIDEIETEIVPLVAAAIKDNQIMANKVEGTTKITIKTATLSLDKRDALNQVLKEQFGIGEETITYQSISSTISNEMRQDAVVSVVVASVCMLIYIWFRFKDIRFGAGAILGLVHDVLVVLSVYALARIPVGSSFIACMLTVIGYSINDTIVIYDRIRENLGKETEAITPATTRELVNMSIVQTMKRSVNTSITTFVMVFMLFLFGVSSIREFAMPLMAGLIGGTYCSLCIATTLWYWMRLRFVKKEAEE